MKIVSRATVDDLYRVPENEKAELVGGELVRMIPTGTLPSAAAGAIYASLRQYQRSHGGGRAYADNTGFLVNLLIVDRSRRTPRSTRTPASR